VPERGWELIEHTADLGLHAWGPTIEDVFAEAAVGLVAVMGTGSGDDASEDVSLEAPDRDALFVDWLSEVLYLFEARRLVPAAARVDITRDPWTLRARLEGTRAETFSQTGPGVKAVTYHALDVSDTDATVYLDV